MRGRQCTGKHCAFRGDQRTRIVNVYKFSHGLGQYAPRGSSRGKGRAQFVRHVSMTVDGTMHSKLERLRVAIGQFILNLNVCLMKGTAEPG
jgi:hypothetical protein